MITSDTIPIPGRDVIIREDVDGVLLFQVRTDEMHYLSNSAFRVFSMCDGSCTTGELKRKLAKNNAECATKEGNERIDRFLQDLAERRLLELWGV